MASGSSARWADALDLDQPGIWRFRSLSRLDPAISAISLGEGNTPLVPAQRYATDHGYASLSFKMESANPTWSGSTRR